VYNTVRSVYASACSSSTKAIRTPRANAGTHTRRGVSGLRPRGLPRGDARGDRRRGRGLQGRPVLQLRVQAGAVLRATGGAAGESRGRAAGGYWPGATTGHRARALGRGGNRLAAPRSRVEPAVLGVRLCGRARAADGPALRRAAELVSLESAGISSAVPYARLARIIAALANGLALDLLLAADKSTHTEVRETIATAMALLWRGVASVSSEHRGGENDAG